MSLRHLFFWIIIANTNFFWAQDADQSSAQAMLQKAILNDSSAEVSNAIRAGATINFEAANRSPLLRAVLLKKGKAVSGLLEAGANPNITYLGQKLVHYAIKEGDLDIAIQLVNAKADFSGILDEGQDAFTYVSTHFNKPVPGQNKQVYWDLMMAMVKHGYDLKGNFNNKDLSNNAWYLAIKSGDTNAIGFFLGWGGQVKNNAYPLPVLADANQVFVYSDGSTWTPLLVAIHYLGEHAKAPHVGSGTIGSLLSYGRANPNQEAKPDNKTQSPLSYLLTVYSDVDMTYRSTINSLMERKANLADAIGRFIHNGGSPDSSFTDLNLQRLNLSWTLLALSIAYDDLEAVKILVSAGANVNKQTFPYNYSSTEAKNQQTPLSIALQKHNSAIAEFLIQHGAQAKANGS